MFDDSPPEQPRAQTVSVLLRRVQATLKRDDALAALLVQGEVSNFRAYNSGHWYFTLKDARAQLKCVMWRSATLNVARPPRDGDQILALGGLDLYLERGDLQFYVEALRAVGQGDLTRDLDVVRARLDADGLFDVARKRPLPRFPRRIAVVTSAQAAAWHDVQTTLARRWPLAEVTLFGAQVQGLDAPPQLVRAVQRADASGADVLLLVRGGGSMEDLWAFNDEALARAVAACRTPTVSGVGHQTDTTLVDWVADQRAPTPTAAAELATPDVQVLRADLADARAALGQALLRHVSAARQQLDDATRQLRLLSPAVRVAALRQRTDAHAARLERAHAVGLRQRQARLSLSMRALEAANPAALLARGYAWVVHAGSGAPVKSAHDVPPGARLRLTLQDGALDVAVASSAATPQEPHA